MDRSKIEDEMEPYMDLLLDIGEYMMAVVQEWESEKESDPLE